MTAAPCGHQTDNPLGICFKCYLRQGRLASGFCPDCGAETEVIDLNWSFDLSKGQTAVRSVRLCMVCPWKQLQDSIKDGMVDPADTGHQPRQDAQQQPRKVRPSTSPIRSACSLLGVALDAPDEEVKKAYRRLAFRYHPDKPEGDEDKMKALTAARQLLVGK